ncbi:MAG: penicillin acylase family protein [Chitinophagaceae bacterium]
MRIVAFIVSLVITVVLIYALNKKWGSIPPLGKFLSPQHGFWQNAEPENADFNANLKFSNLKGKVNVYFDERLVPHVFADNDEDLYFVQGYIHAKFRLWQMEFQTMYAAGRLSEVLGNNPLLIKVDRETRRSGMVYAAQNELEMIEKNPLSKKFADAYTAGVNAYIETLSKADLPVEYKLLDYKPEKWNNLKIALLVKQMSRTLSGNVDDLELTIEKKFIPFSEFNILYPQVPDSLEPIVPKGTPFDPPVLAIKPANADSVYFGKVDSMMIATEIIKPDKNNGSNNWVVAGSKTKSGAPIVCNDPHLDLTFPSIWYEMQLNSPTCNVYGASLPGAPCIVIGFNDSIAWGVTNAQRDVKDFYEIKFKDDSKKQYWFNGQWADAKIHIDTIKVRGAADIFDTVAYTVFGPVMYDKSFPDSINEAKAIACRWTAHDPSNEGLALYYLNRAANYNEYVEAIKHFECPAQNFVFGAKNGDIAIWQQGKFPLRWYGQGLMIMPGEDTSYQWQGFIPQEQNPHAFNPAQGYLVSANQRPADSTYPYFIPGNYINARAIAINKFLRGMQNITPQDMMKLQNNTFNVTAEDARPLLLKYVNEQALNAEEKKYLEKFKNWNLMADANSVGQTIYYTWWNLLAENIWNDELSKIKPAAVLPNQQTMLEALLRDSALKYIDNINTPEKETLYDIITSSFKKASEKLLNYEKLGKLEWTKYKQPRIYHLLRTSLMPFSRAIPVGGNGDIINATTTTHGPSWRMIVQLTQNTEAYAVYPGGQSGNPGSRFYDNFVDDWVNGKYYSLWMMKRSETGDARVKWTMNFGNE